MIKRIISHAGLEEVFATEQHFRREDTCYLGLALISTVSAIFNAVCSDECRVSLELVESSIGVRHVLERKQPREGECIESEGRIAQVICLAFS